MKHNGEHHSSNGSRRPEEILAEIERTRGDMDHTLTAIEQRLTPGQLIDQGLDYLKNSGGREMASNLGVQVKNNPLPIALVGVGLAWLRASSKNPPAREPAWPYEPLDEESARARLGERAHEAMGRISGATDSASQKLGETTQAMRDRMSSAGERVGQLSQSARDTVGNLGTKAKGGMDYMMREQPLALGALGVAIGALFAAMAPRTQKEDELMGSTRDQLLDQAKEVGKEKLEQAKDVAKTVTETATKEAEKKGLTGGSQGAGSQSGSQSGSKPGFQSGSQEQPKPHLQAKPNVPQARPAAAQSPTTTLPPVGGTSGPRRTS